MWCEVLPLGQRSTDCLRAPNYENRKRKIAPRLMRDLLDVWFVSKVPDLVSIWDVLKLTRPQQYIKTPDLYLYSAKIDSSTNTCLLSWVLHLSFGSESWLDSKPGDSCEASACVVTTRTTALRTTPGTWVGVCPLWWCWCLEAIPNLPANTSASESFDGAVCLMYPYVIFWNDLPTIGDCCFVGGIWIFGPSVSGTFCIGRVLTFVKLRAHRATRETLLGGMSTFLELAHIVDATEHHGHIILKWHLISLHFVMFVCLAFSILLSLRPFGTGSTGSFHLECRLCFPNFATCARWHVTVENGRIPQCPPGCWAGQSLQVVERLRRCGNALLHWRDLEWQTNYLAKLKNIILRNVMSRSVISIHESCCNLQCENVGFL